MDLDHLEGVMITTPSPYGSPASRHCCSRNCRIDGCSAIRVCSTTIEFTQSKISCFILKLASTLSRPIGSASNRRLLGTAHTHHHLHAKQEELELGVQAGYLHRYEREALSDLRRVCIDSKRSDDIAACSPIFGRCWRFLDF